MRDRQRWLGGPLGGELPGLRFPDSGAAFYWRERSGAEGCGGLLERRQTATKLPSYQFPATRKLWNAVRSFYQFRQEAADARAMRTRVPGGARRPEGTAARHNIEAPRG